LERLLVHYAPSTTLAATFSNSGTTTVSEVLLLGKATLAGSGTTVVASGGVLDLLITHNRAVADTHTLVYNGAATWGPKASRSLSSGTDAEIENRGSFNVKNDRPLSGTGVFRNVGAERKERAVGVSTSSVCFVDESGGSVIEDAG